MAKEGYIRARMEDDLKERVDGILSAIGLTHTDVITMLYKQIDAYKGIPLELRVPNAETIAAIQDAENGENLTRYENPEEMFASWRDEFDY